jgi:glycosyltransferase involved in cell wall biosynthesis
MKVLVALLSVDFAGTERHAIELANALSQRCEVAVLLRARPAEPHRQAAFQTLRRAVAPHIRIYEASRALPVFGLWHALMSFRPDLIHAHRERTARIASRWSFGIPVVATVHVHFRARDFARCDGLICLTEAEAAQVPATWPGICAVIPNWVLPHHRPVPERLAAMRAQLGLKPGDFVIGSVARLEPVKGLEGLIRAFSHADIPGGRLVIVGDGSQRPALEQFAARIGAPGSVVFTGFRPDARDFYALFDLFVLNSSDEPFGLAILEAAEAGVAVVATATQGARAIAEHLPIQLVPIGSPEALEAALRTGEARTTPPPAITGFGIAERLCELQAFYDRVIARSSRSKSRSRALGKSRSMGRSVAASAVAPAKAAREAADHAPVPPP